MNQEQLRKEAMSILAKHGTQTTVRLLEQLIGRDNAVIKLKWCLEAIEVALTKGAEWEAERDKWISVEKEYPENMQRVLFYRERVSADIYKGILRGAYFMSDHITYGDVTHWQPLPQPLKTSK